MPFHILPLYFLLQRHIQKLFGTIRIFWLYKDIFIAEISNSFTECRIICHKTTSFRIALLRAGHIWTGSPIPAQAPYGDSVRLLVALCKKTTHPAISGWKGQYPSGPLISNSHSLSVLSIIQPALLLYYMHQPVMPDFQPDLKAQTCLHNKMINRWNQSWLRQNYIYYNSRVSLNHVRKKAFVKRKAPFRLVSIVWSHSSSDVSLHD